MTSEFLKNGFVVILITFLAYLRNGLWGEHILNRPIRSDFCNTTHKFANIFVECEKYLLIFL